MGGSIESPIPSLRRSIDKPKKPVPKTKKERIETVGCPDKYKCMDLPKEFIKILKRDDSLKAAGFRFDKVSGKLIFPEGFNNSEKIRKIKKFLDFNGWIYSEKAERLKESDPEEYKVQKFKRYIELTKLSTQIEGVNKKLLQYRYINSIYQDIVDAGFVFRKDEHGNYSLFNPKTGKESTGKYAKLLLQSENLNSFDFELAFLASITNSPEFVDDKGIISQKHVIGTILSKHKIVDESGNKITPTSILLLNWNSEDTSVNILKQINERISHKERINLHEYQELMYLKGFFEHKDYLSEDINRKLYRELNAYNRTEGQVNALSKAAIGAKGEKDMMEKIAGVVKELALPGIVLGLFLAIFSGTRGIGKFLLKAGIGGVVGAKIFDAVNKRVKTLSDDDLGLIIPEQRFYTLGAKQKDYNPGVRKLQDLNKKNLGLSGYTAAGESLASIKDNKTVLDISTDILKSDNDFDVTINATTLHAKLKIANPALKYSVDDVKKYLKLLNSEGFTHDDEDKTIRDYLSEGVDIANKPYETITVFEGIISGGELAPFDAEMNNILKPIYDSTKTDRKKRKEFIKVLETIKSQFSITNILDDFSSRKAAVKSALEVYDPTYINMLDPIFDKYEKYRDIEKQLNAKGLTGFFNAIGDFFSEHYATLLGNPLELSREYTKDINDLKVIRDSIGAPYNTQEPFKIKIARINEIITNIERKQYELEISGIAGRNDVLNEFNGALVYNLSRDIRMRLDEVRSKLSSTDSSSLKGSLSDIKTQFKILDRYKTELAPVLIPTYAIPSGTPTIEVPYREQVISDMHSLDALKDDVKNKAKSLLLPIFIRNKSYIDKVNALTTSLSASGLTNTSIETFVSVGTYIDNNISKGKKADSALDIASSMFPGFELKNSAGDYTTSKMSKLKSEYESIQVTMERKLDDYLNSFTPETIDVTKIKEQAKVLKVIKDKFPTLKPRAEEKEKELREGIKIKIISGFANKLKSVFNISSTDVNEQKKAEILNEFVLGASPYIPGKTFITANIKEFKDAVKTGKFIKGGVTISEGDLVSIYNILNDVLNNI